MIIGTDIISYLWFYVLTPANLLTSLIALFTPYLAKQHILPYIYSPYNYGSIPFNPPSFLESQGLYYFIIIGIISIMYLISGYMATLKVCTDHDWKIVLSNYRYLFLMLICCMLLLIIFPLIKIPFLLTLFILPYANELINGIFWAMFTFIGCFWSNRNSIYQLCGE